MLLFVHLNTRKIKNVFVVFQALLTVQDLFGVLSQLV